MLEIKGLHVSVEGVSILNGVDLVVNPEEIHAIMGPNGAGKSTLAKVLAGHPSYEVTGGRIVMDGQDILELDPEERAHLGLFMSFQYPIEIAGITNLQFLHAAYNAKRKALGSEEIAEQEFEKEVLQPLADKLKISTDFLYRALNDGFSGGEKKRNEILQMAVLDPQYAILDETDSGLDIDALKAIATGVKDLMKVSQKGLILITHYQRLLDYIKPDHVHVMKEGRIVRSGDYTLAHALDAEGYQFEENAQ
jgi:Fe-S cluster assembly ATP-binding protein